MNEIDVQYEVSGATNLVAVLYRGAQIVNATTGALMTDSDGNLPSAAIALSDTGHLFRYLNAAPANGVIANGTYAVRTYLKAGGSLARSDTARPVHSGATTVGPSSTAGAGANAVTITWTNTTNGLPVADGDVWITTDAAGASVVAGTLQTDSNGHATFLLDAGSTYYFWAQKDGVNPVRAQQFVAVAD